jgi:hypothetical protein
MASDLAAIRTKVRKITRSLSDNNISDADIDEYVNTFVLYDFPEHLRLFNFHRTLTWYVQPYQDVYDANSIVPGLTNFDQTNLTINPPIYIAGNQIFFTQSREQFFNIYSIINSVVTTGFAGNGINTAFAGTLSQIPILANNVTFVSIDANNNGLRVTDDGLGNLLVNGLGAPVGAINYVTGVYNFNFAVPPAAGQIVYSETVPYIAAQPLAVLYYDDTFTIRPVPDKVYPVVMEVFVRPAALLAAGQSPELEEFWEYIAIGASRKVFQDRSDYESEQQIMPLFNEKQRLVNRRNIVQLSNERVATIYTEQTTVGNGWGSSYGGGSF